MSLGKLPYRHIHPADLTALREVSPMAERVYVHLAFGERSTPCCLVACDGEWLRYALRARRTSEVVDALGELEAAGWIVWDRDAQQAWLPVQANRTWSGSETTATGWRNDLERFKSSVAKSQARAFIDSAPIAPSKPKAGPKDHSSSSSSSSSISKKTAIAVPAPAYAGDPRPVFAPQTPAVPPMPAAVPTGWGFDPTFRTETPVPIPIKLTPEPLPPEPLPDEPPEDFPEVDWSSIPRTIPDLLPPEDLDVAPVPKLTEAAKARLQAAQAELRLTPPKPERKPPTPAQLDAMFAKEQLRIAVDLWNEALGKTTCGPADFKALQKLAGTLMGNLSKFSHQYGDSPAIMIGWAAERSEYHGGKGSRSWTFQQWFTADHLAAVYADYRKDRGDQRKIHYVPERNLRAWRLENEERAKCIAEGRIYGALFEPMPEVA